MEKSKTGSANENRTTSASNCQECKRLRIRCSRTVPCVQCVRRGVEEICPDGRLTTGRGGRYVLASTEKLHEEIKTLKLRIRDLEQALGTVFQQVSDKRHPLLEPELLLATHTSTATSEEPDRVPNDENPLVNQFGTMQITKGQERWLGATALPEVHLNFHDITDDFEPELEEKAKLALPASALYPIPMLISMAIQNLPPKEEAWSLLETFFQQATYQYSILSREHFVKNILSPAYSDDTSTMSTYKLCSLYSVLSLGALHDLSRPIYSPESREWMEVAQSLVFSSVGQWETSMDSIEAVMLMTCIFPARPELELSKTYYQTAFCMKMAQSIGLHRDPKEFGLAEEESERRRRVFSELCFVDVNESLLYGRPLTIGSRYCLVGSKFDSSLKSAETFKHRIAAIMEEVSDLFTTTKSIPHYSTVMKLDQKIRALTIIPPDIGENPNPSTADNLNLFMRCLWYHSTLLALHRTYFAFAVRRYVKGDPLRGKMAPSILASYDASMALLRAAQEFVLKLPGLLPRLGIVWPHLFTSMVVLYSFGVHMPSWTNTLEAVRMADMTMEEVYLTCTECVRAKEILPYLQLLQQRAQSSLNKQFLRPLRAGLSRDLGSEERDIVGLSVGITVQTNDKASTSVASAAKNPPATSSGRGARELALRQAQLYIFGQPDHTFEPFPSIQQPQQPQQPDFLSTTDFNLTNTGPVANSNEMQFEELLNWSLQNDAQPDTGIATNEPKEYPPPEQISQLELEKSWNEFLLQL